MGSGGSGGSDGGGGGGGGITTNLQNAYMYFNSVLWNAAVLLAQGRLGEALSAANLAAVLSPTVLAIIAIMSSVGLVTGTSCPPATPPATATHTHASHATLAWHAPATLHPRVLCALRGPAGFFLKHLDSVLKSVASALEVRARTLAQAEMRGHAMQAPHGRRCHPRLGGCRL